MNPSFKLDDMIRQLQEIRNHLGKSQGMDLKSRLDSTKTPVMEKASILGDENDPLKPKGLAIEKVSVMDKNPDDFDAKVNDAISEENTDEDDVNKGPKMPGQDSDDDMSEEEIAELERMLKQKVRV